MIDLLRYILIFTVLLCLTTQASLINNLRNRVDILEQQIKSEQQYSPKDIARLKELFYKENK